MASLSRIISLTTANPLMKSTQKRVYSHLIRKPGISKKETRYYKRFLLDRGIRTRHFSLQTLPQIFNEDSDTANQRFQDTAVAMGEAALKRCLTKAGVRAQDIGGLIVATCTGYLCPGLSTYLSERLGLKKDIMNLDLVGLGCGAAIPALRTADHYLKSGQSQYVLVLCVEVCSAALAWGGDVSLILSNSIFSDGAAACLLTNRRDCPGWDVCSFESLLWPRFREALRFKQKNGRLNNRIHPSVPELAAKATKKIFHKLSVKNKKPFHHVAIHPGGRLVLDRVQTALNLDSRSMRPSRFVLRHYGNMSSPSILFVLNEIMKSKPIQPGESAAALSFGAGFSAYGLALQYAAGTER